MEQQSIRAAPFIANDIGYFVFGLAEASVYGGCKSRKLKFAMAFTIS